MPSDSQICIRRDARRIANNVTTTFLLSTRGLAFALRLSIPDCATRQNSISALLDAEARRTTRLARKRARQQEILTAFGNQHVSHSKTFVSRPIRVPMAQLQDNPSALLCRRRSVLARCDTTYSTVYASTKRCIPFCRLLFLALVLRACVTRCARMCCCCEIDSVAPGWLHVKPSYAWIVGSHVGSLSRFYRRFKACQTERQTQITSSYADMQITRDVKRDNNCDN